MISDLRFALRMLIKYPAFSIVAFLAIVLGIGANTTVFGIVNTLLLRPLPVGHSDQVVKVFTTDNHIKGNQPTSYLNFQDFEKQNTAFTSMAAYTFAGMGMTRGSDTVNLTGFDVGFAPDMWVPISMHQWVRPAGDSWFEQRRALLMNVIARLKPGVRMSEAQAQMKTIARQLEQAYPDVNKERSIALMSLEAAKTQGIGGPDNENIARNVSLL